VVKNVKSENPLSQLSPVTVVTGQPPQRPGQMDEVDVPNYHAPDLGYVRRLLAVGDEAAMQGIRRHCAMWRIDVAETIAAARATEETT